MSGFVGYHPVYTTNGEKSQEDETKIVCRSAFGFVARGPYLEQ